MKLLGRLFGFLFAGCLGHLAVPAKSDVLVMLEARQLPFNCTEIGSCISTSTVLLRNIVDMDLNDATRLTQLLGQMEGASAVPDSDLVTMCVQAILPSMEDVPLSTKPELLAGHPGVFLDSASLDATEGMQGYSQYLQNRLLEAGVRILSKEEWQRMPGRPTLTFKYSPRRESAGCIIPYSFSLTLKEETVLIRDPTKKVSSTIWFGTTRENLANLNFQIADAVQEAVDKFVNDWTAANSDG